MKCRGFTLIELLAVIVILAIIFLISAPIILNTVNKSKEEAEQESARSYVAVIKEKITKAMVEYPELKPSNSLNVEVNGTDDTSLKSWDCSNCGTTNKIELSPVCGIGLSDTVLSVIGLSGSGVGSGSTTSSLTTTVGETSEDSSYLVLSSSAVISTFSFVGNILSIISLLKSSFNINL